MKRPDFEVYHGDNLPILKTFPDSRFSLIYIDPPFNTGKVQSRTKINTIRDDNGDRIGFQGRRYRTLRQETKSYDDVFDNHQAFLEPRLREARRILSATGSLFFHIDYREAHGCKLLLDDIFGSDSFMNEIIWAYDYGARSKKKWPPKHDTLFWYAKDPKNYVFNCEEAERICVGTPTDVWWHTIVSPNGKEKTGYPTQKPLGIVNRIVRVHSRPGERLCDFFAGSGTVGESALRLGRKFTLIDSNKKAIEVMRRRFRDHLQGRPVRFHFSQSGGDGL